QRVAGAARAVPLRISALGDEARDDPVEREAVVEALLRERDEALDRLRRVLRVELDADLAALLHRDHRGRMHLRLSLPAARHRRERRHEPHHDYPSPRAHAVLLLWVEAPVILPQGAERALRATRGTVEKRRVRPPRVAREHARDRAD